MTAPSRSAQAFRARMLERRAEVNRDALLVDAADAWRKAGEPDRAITLLTEVSERHDDDSLEATEARVDLGDIACLQHRLNDAVGWYERVLDGRSRGELLEVVVGGDHVALLTLCALCGRLRARAGLGLPPDTLDRVAHQAMEIADFTDLEDEDFPDDVVADAADDGPDTSSPGPYVLPIWRAEALGEARERWPGVDLPASIERHRHDVERSARLLTRDGSRVLLVPVDPERLTVFLKIAELPMTSRAVHAYAHAQHRHGAAEPWPPGRNKECWCGSRRKYKRCCGRSLP